jgi:hypothetical protein
MTIIFAVWAVLALFFCTLSAFLAFGGDDDDE